MPFCVERLDATYCIYCNAAIICLQIYNSTEVVQMSSCPFVLMEGGTTPITVSSRPFVSCRMNDGRPVLLIYGERTLEEYQVGSITLRNVCANTKPAIPNSAAIVGYSIEYKGNHNHQYSILVYS